MLLSEVVQADLGFVKDMRKGIVYMTDIEYYLQAYRSQGTDLKVIFLSERPSVAEHRLGSETCCTVPVEKRPTTPAPAYLGDRQVSESRSSSPQKTLAANPAKVDPDSGQAARYVDSRTRSVRT